MLRRHRARRGPYAMAAPSVIPSVIRSLILLALLGLLLYGTAKAVLWVFGGSTTQQTSAQLTVEPGGSVSISVDDGLLRPVEDTMKIYTGDRVVTSSSAFAQIRPFDGTITRVDSESDLQLGKSDNESETPEWQIVVTKGALWVRTPDAATYSGASLRSVKMPTYEAFVTTDTEAVFEESRLMVFSADGQGISVQLDGLDESVVIGEGQQFTVPEGEVGPDPYRYRSAIEPLAVERSFIEKSRTMFMTVAPVTESGSIATESEDILVVTTPADGTTVTTSTVKVEGRVASTITRVRINGYDATVAADHTFMQELAFPEATSMTLLIEAMDARGLTLDQISRTVFKGSQTVASPTITSPAAAGQTYRTQKAELSISGTAPANTAGLMVNDYRLQLFRSGDTTWSYLASKALGNLRDGTNVYSIVALDAAGNRSAAVLITILVEEGAEGVVGGTSGNTSSQPQESELPNNVPLMPGTITVTGPAAGSSYTATGSEFLLEGTTPRETASVWVNGYRLQLYKAGQTFWNYIAKTEYNTLKPGTNVYKIVARNGTNEILDSFEYTVTYNP